MEETTIIDHLKNQGINEVKCVLLKSNRPEEYSSLKLTVSELSFEALKIQIFGQRVRNNFFSVCQNPGEKMRQRKSLFIQIACNKSVIKAVKRNEDARTRLPKWSVLNYR
ncbi:hypothetical protein WA026_007921 [Henosepilachna vigintioctopunctata]|uniref:Uncharacterized protein n=1 Tax=Henosepilachna vigintioctopunctata TaxID=420089 RepID=A0AAW1U3H6_9CUCU